MNLPGLKLEQIPALHIPFRFFNTAPWLGVLAALVLLSSVGDQQWLTHWNPTLLAAAHLLTLGFMTMTMVGALFQVLPVISGEQIKAQSWIAPIVHLSLLLGTIIFAWAFSSREYALFRYALPLLTLALISFLTALGAILTRRIAGGHSLVALRYAAVSLLLVVLLGLLKGLNYLDPDSFVGGFGSPSKLLYLHLAWGFGGWVLLLIMGVSFQVIPMFHVTPNFSPMLTKYLPPAVFLSLVLLTVLVDRPGQGLAIVLLCGLAGCYGGYALWLLSKRRRKVPDVTVNFWRLGLGHLMLAALLVGLRYFMPDLELRVLQQFGWSIDVLIGLILLVGFACSVIMGMLLKIVPFLIYMQLQRRCGTRFELLSTLPNMRELISAPQGRWQFRGHIAAIILLVLSLMLPAIERLAVLVLLLDFAWLGVLINNATRLYWKSSQALK